MTGENSFNGQVIAEKKSMKDLRIGIDTGGTFTDITVLEEDTAEPMTASGKVQKYRLREMFGRCSDQ